MGTEAGKRFLSIAPNGDKLNAAIEKTSTYVSNTTSSLLGEKSYLPCRANNYVDPECAKYADMWFHEGMATYLTSASVADE